MTSKAVYLKVLSELTGTAYEVLAERIKALPNQIT